MVAGNPAEISSDGSPDIPGKRPGGKRGCRGAGHSWAVPALTALPLKPSSGLSLSSSCLCHLWYLDTFPSHVPSSDSSPCPQVHHGTFGRLRVEANRPTSDSFSHSSVQLAVTTANFRATLKNTTLGGMKHQGRGRLRFPPSRTPLTSPFSSGSGSKGKNNDSKARPSLPLSSVTYRAADVTFPQ